MEHIPFNPTPEQRANLERLAAHLDLGATNLEFDMETFQKDADGAAIPLEPNVCGSVGCAVGHGPSLGIAPREYENWGEYSDRCFGTQTVGHSHDSFEWMFGQDWVCLDNTPRGAAARIRYALKHGIPANAIAQANGDAPLSYTVPDFPEHVNVVKEPA